MPLVFVHGVNVRPSPRYEREIRLRDSLFRRFAFRPILDSPHQVTILNPLWGDLGVKFHWNHASLPKEGGERFGGSGEELLALLVGETLGQLSSEPNAVMLEMARVSLMDAIDLLWTACVQQVTNDSQSESLAALAEQATNYALSHPRPSWLEDVRNDSQFLNELAFHVNKFADTSNTSSKPEIFGINEVWEQLKVGRLRVQEAISRVLHTPGREASQAFLRLVRSSVNEQASCFLGDAFVYLEQRGNLDAPGEIVSKIISTLVEANRRVNTDDPKLIVVAHSMGGNIVYDILSYFLPKFHPDLKIHVLVTVGSQVGVFEEMKLFRVSNKAFPNNPTSDRVPPLSNVDYWLNVYDLNDVFAFAVENIFEGARDFCYCTGKDLLMAHSSYFTMPSFHRQFSDRLRNLL